MFVVEHFCFIHGILQGFAVKPLFAEIGLLLEEGILPVDECLDLTR